MTQYSTTLHTYDYRIQFLHSVVSSDSISVIASVNLIPNSVILNLMCNGREDKIELNIRDMMGVLWACTKIKVSRSTNKGFGNAIHCVLE